MALVALLLLVCGCQSGEPIPTVEPSFESEGSTKRQELVIGVTYDYPPIVYQMADGTKGGVDHFLALELCDRLSDYDCTVKEVDYEQFKEGWYQDVDILLGGLGEGSIDTVNMLYSEPYLCLDLELICKTGKEPKLLTNEPVGILPFFTGLIDDAREVEYETVDEMLAALEAGEVVAIALPIPIAKECLRIDDTLGILETDYGKNGEWLRIAVFPSKQKILPEINAILEELQEEGIVDDWLLRSWRQLGYGPEKA